MVVEELVIKFGFEGFEVAFYATKRESLGQIVISTSPASVQLLHPLGIAYGCGHQQGAEDQGIWLSTKQQGPNILMAKGTWKQGLRTELSPK